MTRARGFLVAMYAFAVTMLGTTLPTPLYPLFERRYGLGELSVTVIYAVYALGVIGGLVAFGNLSDQVGRKPVLVLGLCLSAVSALLFLFTRSVPPIYVARVVSGLSAGIFTGTATAYLVDLAPGGDRRRAGFVAVVVNLGGLGTGTLLSGLLAQWAPYPLRVPFAVDLCLLALTSTLVLVPETVERGPLRLRPQRLGVPPEVRGVFLRGSAAAFASFAVAGVFGAVAPTFLGRVLHRDSPALAGSIVFVFFGMSLVGQLAIRGMSDRSALLLGCALLLGGIALLALSLLAESLAALVASALVAGIGQGVVIGAALAAIAQRAPVERRGEAASSFFVVAYVGLSVPVVAAGLAIHATSLRPAALGFSAVVAALVLAVLVSQARAERLPA